MTTPNYYEKYLLYGESEASRPSLNKDAKHLYLKYAENSSGILQPNSNIWQAKYLKYKNKYNKLKAIQGGGLLSSIVLLFIPRQGSHIESVYNMCNSSWSFDTFLKSISYFSIFDGTHNSVKTYRVVNYELYPEKNIDVDIDTIKKLYKRMKI